MDDVFSLVFECIVVLPKQPNVAKHDVNMPRTIKLTVVHCNVACSNVLGALARSRIELMFGSTRR
jgi:hypothetical protein